MNGGFSSGENCLSKLVFDVGKLILALRIKLVLKFVPSANLFCFNGCKSGGQKWRAYSTHIYDCKSAGRRNFAF